MNNKSMLETLVSNDTTIHSFTKQQISSILDQTMKDIDRFERDAENHKKEIEKLKKEIERYQKRDSLQGEEITALQKLANVPLNDELVRKVAKKELKREQKKNVLLQSIPGLQIVVMRTKNHKGKTEKKAKKQIEESESSESKREDEKTQREKPRRKRKQKKTGEQ